MDYKLVLTTISWVVHSKIADQQKSTREKITKYRGKETKCTTKRYTRLIDMGLFHAAIEDVLDKSKAKTVATFISSHRKAIANSV